MASIATKIVHTSLYEVKLYKEGVFWVAYEQSAFFINLVKGYKPTKKWYKNIQKEVVQVGFPNLNDFLNNDDFIKIFEQDCFIRFKIKTSLEQEKFKVWKTTTPIFQ
tara:strand:- start:397 stop:717 length:321 start_codon:yes stop_codon:yes gene_type:complete